MMATEMATTGIMVEIIPVPIPFDNNRGRACSAMSAIFCVCYNSIGVIFCCLSDDDSSDKTADDRERKAEPVLYAQQIENGDVATAISAATLVPSPNEWRSSFMEAPSWYERRRCR